MEPYLPVTSQAVRFCISGTTVLFWVSIFLNHHFNVYQSCWSSLIMTLTQTGFNHDINICFYCCPADFSAVMQNAIQFRFKKNQTNKQNNKPLEKPSLIINLIGHFSIGITFSLAYVLLTDHTEKTCSKGKKTHPKTIIHYNEISTYSSLEISAEWISERTI